MPERISEGYTEALNAIAEAGREIARAVAAVTATPPWTTREAYATEDLADTARQRDDARRDLEPVRQLMHDALSQRDALRVEVHALREIAPQLHKIWPGPSTDRAEVMDVVDVLTEQARDATQAPAEQPQPASGGNRTGGGSCARCGAGITLPANDPENREMAVCAPCEIGLLRDGYRDARAQVERVRAQLVRMTKSSDEGTRRHGMALLRILDGQDVPQDAAAAPGGLVAHQTTLREGRCLTCPGGYGRHKVGGEYPELPHEVVVVTKDETNENEEA